MEDGLMSLEIIKATQTALGKYIKRPQLSEKLLKKPPFRFLHDIITNVVKTTGFFEGLFEDNELISDNVKDRDSKILFLNKVICVLSATTGKSLSVKPSKIVAGQEPEKTNELLQCLAQALEDKLSSKEAVRVYKEDGKLPNKEHSNATSKTSKNLVNRPSDTKKLISKSTEKLTNREKDSNLKDRSDTKIKKKESGVVKNESQSKNLPQSKTVPRKSQMENKSKPSNKLHPTTKTSTPKTATTEEIENNRVTNNLENINSVKDEIKNQIDTNSHTNNKITINETQVNLETKSNYTENDVNSSRLTDELVPVDKSLTNDDSIIKSLSNDDIRNEDSITTEFNKDNNINLDGTINGMSQQQNTKIVEDFNKLDNHVVDVEKSSNSTDGKTSENPTASPIRSSQNFARPITGRPSSSRPGAPRLKEKLENYLSDTDNVLLGKVNIIAEHSHNEEEEEGSITIVEQDNFTSPGIEAQIELTSEHEHGHLVQQILNSQKELNEVKGKTEIEWQFGAQRAKEAQNQEIDTLRYNIQALSRVANPLGKLLDHIQEDVEVMRQELQQWTSIYEEVSKEMHIQKTSNEGTLLPLHSKLKQIEEEIQEKHEKMNDLKILVHKNSTKIEKLLAVNNS